MLACSTPILADGNSGVVGNILEVARAIVAIEIIGLAVVGDEEIEMAVLIKVSPDGRQTEALLRIGNAGVFGDFREGAVAIVVVESVGETFEAARAALDVNAVVLAGFAGAEDREIVETDVHVVGNEQVGPTIAVIVTERGTHGPAFVERQTGLLGDVSEGAVSVVAVEHNPVETGDQQIGPAVVIVVADRDAIGPTGIAHSGFIRDISERSVVIIVEERAAGFFAGFRHLDALRVREINVRPAVSIIINESNSAAHGFHDVFLFRAGQVLEMDSGRASDVHKLG